MLNTTLIVLQSESKIDDISMSTTDIGPEFGDVRPLDEDRMRMLTLHGVQLLDRIDADDAFITELSNVGCITWSQRKHIAAISIVQQRNRKDKLLEFFIRRSVADFNILINVLSKGKVHSFISLFL